jgi:hypothetical protein
MGFAAGLRLPELPLIVPRWYLWLKNALWGLGSLIAAIALFFGQTWAPSLTRWLAGVLIGWYWFDRLLLAQSEFAQHTWPLAIAITVLVAACLLWILSRRSVRGFFREKTL